MPSKMAVEKRNLTGVLAWAAKKDVPFDVALESLHPLFSMRLHIKGMKPFYSNSLRKACIDLKNGYSLSRVLEDHFRWWLPDYYIQSIMMAEEKGNLKETLIHLSETSQHISRRKKEVLTLVIYPCILVLFIINFCAFLSIFIIPKYRKIMEDIVNVENLPESIAYVNFIGQLSVQSPLGLFILIQFPVLIYLIFFTQKLDRVFAYIPILRRPLLKWKKLEGVQALSVFLKNGMPLTEAIEMVIHTQIDSSVKHKFIDLRRLIKDGKSVDAAWQEVFPKDHLENFYIKNGIMRNDLASNLDLLSTYLHDVNNMRMKLIIKIASPVILVFLGAVIAIICCLEQDLFFLPPRFD